MVAMDLPDPISRRDRQRQTREALIFTARMVFAEDGYHGARLEEIARRAGFSKGAIYSNFDGKAGLFLAVMDANMEIAFETADSWDPFGRPEPPQPPAVTGDWDPEEFARSMIGFSLATLEFIAAAARDEALAPELGKRLRRLLAAYTGIAREQRAEGDPMTAEEIGVLIAALDQGAGMLTVGGSGVMDQRLLQAGMGRLLDPARAATAPPDDDAADGLGLHSEEIQRRIAEAVREGLTELRAERGPGGSG